MCQTHSGPSEQHSTSSLLASLPPPPPRGPSPRSSLSRPRAGRTRQDGGGCGGAVRSGRGWARVVGLRGGSGGQRRGLPYPAGLPHACGFPHGVSIF